MLISYVVCGMLGAAFAADAQEAKPVANLTYVLNSGSTPKDVHGKPYQDPKFLLSEGYNGMVIGNLTTAITYDNFEKNLVKKGSKARKWIDSVYVERKKETMQLEASGIPFYSNIDFLVFPAPIWDKYGKQIKGENPDGHAQNTFSGSKERPDIQQEMSQKLLVAQIDGLFKAFPELDGVVSRFGETYLHSTPYHKGNSPIKNFSYETEIKDQIAMLRIMREEICVKRNKKLFFRTWSFGNGFHNNPQYYLDVTNAIEPHPNLIFSIKYPQDDFHRMCATNPTLGIGRHQQIVEAQSAMEAYGKGAHPYYTASGVIDGWPENRYELDNWTHKLTEKLAPVSKPRGVRDIMPKGKLVGMWTWSSGGGWQGPYLKSTVWNDLNSYVISHWAQNTLKSEEELCYEFAAQIGITGFNAQIFRKIAVESIEAVRKGQLSDYTKNSVWWARDNFFSASYNNEVVKEIVAGNLMSRVLAEKAEAAAMWLKIEALSKQFELKDKALEEILQVSCSYGRIKYQLTEQMWYLMIQKQLKNEGKNFDKEGVKVSIARYDALWREWRELAKSPYCASLYKDLQFYDERKGSIGELVDGLRTDL